MSSSINQLTCLFSTEVVKFDEHSTPGVKVVHNRQNALSLKFTVTGASNKRGTKQTGS